MTRWTITRPFVRLAVHSLRVANRLRDPGTHPRQYRVATHDPDAPRPQCTFCGQYVKADGVDRHIVQDPESPTGWRIECRFVRMYGRMEGALAAAQRAPVHTAAEPPRRRRLIPWRFP